MHEYTKYFKNIKEYDRFIKEIYKKYKSISNFSGNIKLESITKEEAKVLSRLYNLKLKENETISLSIKKFIKIMNNSKFEDFNIETFISEYLNIKLETNKERNEKQKKEETLFYENILKENSLCSMWLKKVIETKETPYNIIHFRYTKNKVALKKELNNIINLIDNLPKEKTLISIYAGMHTKDPHYLDIDNTHSSLFFHALSKISNHEYPITRKEKIKLLSINNIEIDIISNYVITYNLQSDKNYINEFSKNNQTLILNTQNIINIKKINGINKKVFIFENPSMLNEILASNLKVSIIISNGFINTSVYLLLDKLIENNNTLYYNGDHDSEGLLIADKLQSIYRDNLKLICYEKEDYYNGISTNEISSNRLTKLNKIKNKELFLIRDLIKDNKKSSYQENNKERIVEKIKITIKKIVL